MTPTRETASYSVVERNLRRAMSYYALAPEGGDLTERDGLVLVSSGINFGPFNAALIVSPSSELELRQLLREAAGHFGARKLRWSCWVCEDLLEERLRANARRVFADHRMYPLTDPPGMLAERVEPASRWLPELECRRVEDAVTRLAFCEITSTVFEVPFSVSQRVYDSERAWALGLTGWVGYAHGRAVATTASIVAAGAIGIYSVATLPRHRRQGFAEALMRHALETARQETGLERSVLQSTRAGMRMYQRMGFRQVTRFSVYMAG